MITFTFAFRGWEEHLIDLAEVMSDAFDLDLYHAFRLAQQAIDLERELVLQVSDAAFGRFNAGIMREDLEPGAFDHDISVAHEEPDPVLYSVHTLPVPRHVQLYNELSVEPRALFNSDGCCHRTVLMRCKGCPYRETA